MRSPESPPLWTRLLIFAGLLVLAAFALPVSAAMVESLSGQAENWIAVVYVALVVLAGALIGAFAPSTSGAPTRRGRILRWAAAGLLAAVVAYAGWLFLLAG